MNAAANPRKSAIAEFPAGAGQGFAGLTGESSPMRRLFEQIRRAAPSEATVLITGESGTGKEAVAQALHDHSARAGGVFMAVNCGAIPPGLIEAELLGHEKGSFTGAEKRRAGYFERAHGGTIFLDEITEMPLEMQVKLLRVLESRRYQRVGGVDTIEVDVRVLAATNRDLDTAVREGHFREDLMYRLAVFPLRVPPLRERGDDVVLIAQHLLEQLNRRENRQKRYSRQFLRELSLQTWPGNVRELKNLISRAYILADDIIEFPAARNLPQRPALRRREDLLLVPVGTPLARAQRELIFATLRHHGGDKRRTARTLGISLKTLYNRLESYAAEPG